MQKIETLIEARWIVPMAPLGTILENHALAIDGGRILGLAPIPEAASRWQPARRVTLDTHALMPGLVNMHAHLAMTLFRGMADDLQLMDWLQNHIWPAEQRWVNPDFVRAGTRLACAEMLRGGTTCFNDMYFFPEETVEVATQLGMRTCVGHVIIDFPTQYARTPDEYLHKAETLHQRFQGQALVKDFLAPHAPYTVSDDTLKKVMDIADRLAMPIHMHIHETADEIDQSMGQYGMRPLERLDKLGLLSRHLIAVHMTQLSEAEIRLCGQRGLHIAHCPQSNMKLASGFMPAHALMQAGANVCLGTDGAASNNDLDMFSELQSGAMLAKAVARDATALPAWKALEMATLNGAKALGLEAEIGSLTPGKAADCIAVDMQHPATQPIYHLASQLAYAVNSQQVSDVWIHGRQLLDKGGFTHLDWSALRQDVQIWRDRITLGRQP